MLGLFAEQVQNAILLAGHTPISKTRRVLVPLCGFFIFYAALPGVPINEPVWRTRHAGRDILSRTRPNDPAKELEGTQRSPNLPALTVR